MSYAIMRTKKLKMGGAAASLSHTFRERLTPNADPELKHTNRSFQGSAKSTQEAMEQLRSKLPDRYRKDAVVAIEYLMTTSPEWAENATKEQQKEFFIKSKKWLNEKHGKDNVFVAQVHNDETTPHLVAYVVPLSNTNPDTPYRLCAKDFLGGRAKLTAMQTSFHETVRHLGLERGIEGSLAKHQRVKQHYANVINAHEKKPPIGISLEDLEPQKIGTFKKEEKYQVVNRINEKVTAQSKAFSMPMVALANEGLNSKRQSAADRQTAKKLEIQARAYRGFVQDLTKNEAMKIVDFSNKLREQKHQEKLKLEAEKKQQQELKRQQKQTRKGPKLGM